MTISKYAALCFFVLSSLKLFSQDFQINNYEVSIQLKQDGSFDVTEKINLDFFKKMRGIYRNITTTKDVGNHTQTIQIDNIDTGETTKKVTEKQNEVEIRLGKSNKYLIGPQSYIISYTVKNAITPYEQHDEFYWSLTGNQWKEDIKSLTFTIGLPNDIDLSPQDIAAFTNKTTNAQHANIRYNDRIITGSSRKELGNGEGMSIAFKTPKGYFPQLNYDSIFDKTGRSTNASRRPAVSEKEYPRDFAFPLPALLICGLLYFFNLKGRNKKRAALGATYFPPEGLNPPEIGVFHDFQVNHRDLISLIPYWGEQGYLKVASIDKDDGTIDMRFEKQVDLPMQTPTYESDFFNAIFKKGDSVYLHDLEHEMHKSFYKVGRALKAEVLDMKLYDVEANKIFHGGLFIVLGLLSIGSAILAGLLFHAFISVGLLILLSLVCFYIHFHKPKKNDLGLALHDHLVALKQTLENPDSKELNSIIKTDPTYLDKIFPYVVALGLDDTWTKHVSPIFDKAPAWYYGDGVHRRPDFHTFNQGFSTSRIGKTMTSMPVADNSSSAFGGGGYTGSSGGGFGGGGGGGGW